MIGNVQHAQSARFQSAIGRFDQANSEDPNREVHEGRQHPKELLYARRMSRWLDQLEPEASEPLRLAVRSQHIRRWEIPREDYPKGRDGYRRWRTDLGRFHAETAGRILQEVGYDETTISRVQSLLRKERLKTDPECQLLEDVICLVFLEFYLQDFAQEHDEEKLINILRRTWKKMSPRGHKAALQLDLPDSLRALVRKAIGG